MRTDREVTASAEPEVRRVPWWSTSVLEPEVDAVARAIRDRRIAMGPITEAFEREMAERLDVPHALAVPSGSVALLMALLAHDIGPGDQVIVPNRTFIATAHAVSMAGASPILVDVCGDVPLIDLDRVEASMTPRTRAIMPVHLNGRAVDMDRVRAIAERHNLVVIEDACQALFSRRGNRWLGTESPIGCYSLGVAKLITCGYGGVVVCHDPQIRDRLVELRNHGVLDSSRSGHDSLGFNFKFSDMLASIARVQLDRASEHMARVSEIYRRYRGAVADCEDLDLIPVDVDGGEVPLYAEVLSSDPDRWRTHFAASGIECQDLARSLHRSPHLTSLGEYPASIVYDEQGFILPSGPTQSLQNVNWVVRRMGEPKGCG